MSSKRRSANRSDRSTTEPHAHRDPMKAVTDAAPTMPGSVEEHAPAAGPAPDLVIGADGLARPRWASTHDDLRTYYDTEWGMPVRTEQGVFERLCLEGFQSGLSWATILRRREGFRCAFTHFDPDVVARFGPDDIDRLLTDKRIIRHRGKIEATIANARATLALRVANRLGAHGDLGPGATLADLVWSYRPARTPIPRTMAEVPTTSAESRALAAELKDRGFRFVGPTTMFALMEAIGIVDTHLVGSHRRGSSGMWGADGAPITTRRQPGEVSPHVSASSAE